MNIFYKGVILFFYFNILAFYILFLSPLFWTIYTTTKSFFLFCNNITWTFNIIPLNRHYLALFFFSSYSYRKFNLTFFIFILEEEEEEKNYKEISNKIMLLGSMCHFFYIRLFFILKYVHNANKERKRVFFFVFCSCLPKTQNYLFEKK